MNSPRDPLSTTLQQWRVQPPTDPYFRPGVWRRISRRSQETWATYVRGHLLPWSVAAVMAMAAAGWSGRVLASVRLEAARDAMADRYLSELDPRVQARLRH